MTVTRFIVLVGLVTLATVIVFQIFISFDRYNAPKTFSSNGERIYFTGKSISGSSITSTGGDSHMGMHSDTRSGCARCHGNNREGGFVQTMFNFSVVPPPITPEALFRDQADIHSQDEHGDHGSYDDESLKLAIRQGIDPAGKRLDMAMPRWTMSDSDIDDLISYLRSQPNDKFDE